MNLEILRRLRVVTLIGVLALALAAAESECGTSVDESVVAGERPPIEVTEPPERVVTRVVTVPGPERVVTVPGPERVVTRIVTVPGPERIVTKVVTVEVPAEPTPPPSPAEYRENCGDAEAFPVAWKFLTQDGAYWEITWQATLTSTVDHPINRAYYEVTFFDKDGFQLEYSNGFFDLAPHESITLTGTDSIEAALGSQVVCAKLEAR